MLPGFEALRLNKGTSEVQRSSLLDANTWREIERDLVPKEGPCVWGIDLSDGAAMAAVAAYWTQTGRLEAVAGFGDNPGLQQRGLKDGVGRLYLDMEKRGELFVSPGSRTVNTKGLIREAMDRFGKPSVVCADRWRERELRDVLDGARVPAASLSFRGQGFKDGAEDVREFRRACLDGQVSPVKSLLLRAAMAEACTISDPAGNMKLAKNSEGGRRKRHRDDACAAAILAVAEGTRRRTEGARPRRLYLGVA